MKAQTMHTNVFGTVINPTSATGFRLEDDHGAWVEANVVDGVLKVDYGIPMSPPVPDVLVATKLDDPVPQEFGQQYGRILRDPPRRIIDYPCPVEFRDPAPPVRTIAEYMQATHDMFDHGHPTTDELIAATKSKCTWPDCGHDTNQSNPDPRCNGAYCPKPGEGS